MVSQPSSGVRITAGFGEAVASGLGGEGARDTCTQTSSWPWVPIQIVIGFAWVPLVEMFSCVFCIFEVCSRIPGLIVFR